MFYKKKLLSLVISIILLFSTSNIVAVYGESYNLNGKITVTVIDMETGELFDKDEEYNFSALGNGSVHISGWSTLESNPHVMENLYTDYVYYIKYYGMYYDGYKYFIDGEDAGANVVDFSDGNLNKEITLYLKKVVFESNSDQNEKNEETVINDKDIKQFRNLDFNDLLKLSDKEIYEMSAYSKEIFKTAAKHYRERTLNQLYIPYEFTKESKRDQYESVEDIPPEEMFTTSFYTDDGKERVLSRELISFEYGIPAELFEIMFTNSLNVFSEDEFIKIPVVNLMYNPLLKEYTSRHVELRMYMKIIDYYYNTEKLQLFPFYSNENPILGYSETITGDIDDSKIVDLSDLTSLSLYLLKELKYSEQQKNLSDLNADGLIDLTDLAMLKQFVMGDNITLGFNFF